MNESIIQSMNQSIHQYMKIITHMTEIFPNKVGLMLFWGDDTVGN